MFTYLLTSIRREGEPYLVTGGGGGVGIHNADFPRPFKSTVQQLSLNHDRQASGATGYVSSRVNLAENRKDLPLLTFDPAWALLLYYDFRIWGNQCFHLTDSANNFLCCDSLFLERFNPFDDRNKWYCSVFVEILRNKQKIVLFIFFAVTSSFYISPKVSPS